MKRAAVSTAILASWAASSAISGQSQFLQLAPRWSYELSAPPVMPPVVAGARVIVPLLPGAVVALDAATGRTVWNVELLAERPIAADSSQVYIAAGGMVHALQLSTGETVWRAKTGIVTATPLVRSGWIVVASGGTVSAMRTADGSVVWQRALGAVEYRPAIDGDLLVVPLADRRVAGVDLRSGDVLWEQPLGGAPGEPLAVGGRIYAGASDKFFYALRASNGEVDWRHQVGAAPRGAAAADDDHVYFVAMDNILRALDRGNGALVWPQRLRFRPAEGPVLIGNGVLVPGLTAAPPVFGRRDGAKLTDLRFPATLTAMSNVAAEDPALPFFAMVTGDLNQPWTIWMIETSTAPPEIPVVPLTALPGEVLAIVPPR